MQCPDCQEITRRHGLGQGIVLTVCGVILIAIALSGCIVGVYPIVQ